MLRQSRWCMLTFDALLSRGLPASSARAAALCWQKLAPSAPLPAPVAVPLIASNIREGKVRDGVLLLAVHPKPLVVLDAVLEDLQNGAERVALAQLEQLLDLLRSSGAAGATKVLAAMAKLVAQKLESNPPSGDATDAVSRGSSGSGAHSSHEENRGVSDDTPVMSERKHVRHALLRHIRFQPHAAASLIGPLCQISDPNANEVSDVMDTLQIAVKGNGVLHPRDLASVLVLVAESGRVRDVVALWSWMRHTSVCWDVEAASAAMQALSATRQLQDVVLCMQDLAEAGHSPTPAAQLSFLHFLSTLRPPLPEYAKQLVKHWYPNPATLWVGEEEATRRVGMSLVGLLHHCHDVDSLEEVLREAHGVLKTESSQRLFSFLAAPAMGEVAMYFAELLSTRHSRVADEVKALLFHVPISHLAQHCAEHGPPQPSVLAGLAVVGYALDATDVVLGAFSRISVDAVAFAHISRKVTEAPLGSRATPEVRLQWIETLGRAVHQEVPEEVRVWLELVGSSTT